MAETGSQETAPTTTFLPRRRALVIDRRLAVANTDNTGAVARQACIP